MAKLVYLYLSVLTIALAISFAAGLESTTDSTSTSEPGTICGDLVCNVTEVCVNQTCVPCRELCNTTDRGLLSSCYEVCKETAVWYFVTPFELRTRLIAGFVAAAASVIIMLLLGYCIRKLDNKIQKVPEAGQELEERTYIEEERDGTVQDRPGIRPLIAT